MIAHYLPGLGNPLQLRADEMLSYLSRLGTIIKMTSGSMSEKEMMLMQEGVHD